MAEKRKQDWSTRLSHVWVLTLVHPDTSATIKVFRSEQSMLEGLSQYMGWWVDHLSSTTPEDDKARIRELLAQRSYKKAARKWSEVFNETWSWEELPIEGVQ